MDIANSLRTNGYVVVNSDVFNASSVPAWRAEFIDTIQHFPEFSPTATRFVAGSFAALGNPASFHNPFVRKMRQWAMATLIPVFRHLYPNEQFKLEQLHDRMLYRLAKDKVSAESWHRDEAPTAAATDHTFGGWVNLDEYPQYFSCVRKSHNVQRSGNGFAKISKDESREIDESEDRVRVEIPPGNILIFYEHILHEVMSTAMTYISCRLFLGWRLTHANTPLMHTVADLRQRLEDQAVMPLKSGQIPPMYPALFWVNHRGKLVTWSQETFPADLRENKTMASGKDKGSIYNVVKRHLGSLTDLGLDTYAPYTTNEFRMHVPGRKWRLLVPGRQRVKSNYSLD